MLVHYISHVLVQSVVVVRRVFRFTYKSIRVLAGLASTRVVFLDRVWGRPFSVRGYAPL